MKPRTASVLHVIACAVSVFAVCLSVPGLLFAQETQEAKDPAPKAPSTPNATNDTLFFFQGNTYFYNGKHDAARDEFKEYERAHPDDLLVESRVILNQWMEMDGKAKAEQSPTAETINALLERSRAAIARYHARKCADTDLSIAGGTLDCDYVGESLYAYDALIQWDFGSKWKAYDDYAPFSELGERSRSLQALFLLGFFEYKASRQSIFARPMLFGLRLPHDHQDAVELILRSMQGNTSPFVEDIRFFIFDAECGCAGHGHHKKDGAFAKDYPLNQLAAWLNNQYPKNGQVADFVHETESGKQAPK